MIPYHKGWDLFIDWDPPIFAWKGRSFYMIRAGQWRYVGPMSGRVHIRKWPLKALQNLARSIH